jgi:hypothetical protein
MDTEKQAENGETSGRKPTHFAYWVKDREEKTSIWRQIGVAWEHADKKGMSIHLDLQPLDGRVTLRLAEEKK